MSNKLLRNVNVLLRKPRGIESGPGGSLMSL